MAELEPILGYLNFSEGRPDPRFQRQLNEAYAELAVDDSTPWIALRLSLERELDRLHREGKSAFKETVQAAAAVRLVFDHVVPSYRKHHADLLFHLDESDFFAPFFLARVFEAVLGQRGPWEEENRVIAGCLQQLNDYVGHRPVAVLENARRGEIYAHEWVRPIPLPSPQPARRSSARPLCKPTDRPLSPLPARSDK